MKIPISLGSTIPYTTLNHQVFFFIAHGEATQLRWATIFLQRNRVLDGFDGVEAGVEGGGTQKLHQDLRDILKGKRKARTGPKFHRVCFKPRIFCLGVAFLRNSSIKVFDFFLGNTYYVYLRWSFWLIPYIPVYTYFRDKRAGSHQRVYLSAFSWTDKPSHKKETNKKHGWIAPSQYPLIVETMFFVLDSKRSWESINWTCSHRFVLESWRGLL